MKAVDLFAGIGGNTEGARMANVPVVWAANHWPLAVEWHSANHPETVHACQDLQQADFRDAPQHDLLMASPACQGHSPARGKDKPHHDAQRATAWAVVTCAELHRPAVVMVENVTAFAERWVLFPAWCAAMHALGYALSFNRVDAADHGVPQNRERLFIVATRSKHPIELDLPRRPHVGASNVIDFATGVWSPVAGHVPATLARVAAGRRSFGERFLAPYYGSGSGETGRDIARPIGTLTTRDRWAVIDGDRMRMISRAESIAFMGFPADYRLPTQVKEAKHLLGNAVCPLVARDVINALKEAA